MKRRSLVTVLWVIVLLLIPYAGRATMIALSDEELSEVTGQAGITGDTLQGSFDTHIDTMTALGGILNYSDVTINGSVEVRSPLSQGADIVTRMNPLNSFGAPMMSLGIFGFGMIGHINHTLDMTINIDQFTIGAIRIGSDTTGPSLGSFAMYGFQADIRGTVSITTH